MDCHLVLSIYYLTNHRVLFPGRFADYAYLSFVALKEHYKLVEFQYHEVFWVTFSIYLSFEVEVMINSFCETYFLFMTQALFVHLQTYLLIRHLQVYTLAFQVPKRQHIQVKPVQAYKQFPNFQGSIIADSLRIQSCKYMILFSQVMKTFCHIDHQRAGCPWKPSQQRN